jgi:uncharacterized repeat protein (TIGR03803 family)
MFRKRRAICSLAVGLLAAMACITAASAGRYKQIHSFCGQIYCGDGANPQAGLTADGAGNFYGTTYFGGVGVCGGYGCGTAFELSPKADGKYKLTVLHRFCAETNCAEGGLPMAGLIVDTAGNLYGTANVGGGNGAGSAFEIKRNSDGKRTVKVLHHFCAETNCNDGGGPQFDGLTYQGQASGAAYDGISPLYGTNFVGGTGGLGVVYEMKPPASGKNKWSERVLYNFCTQARTAGRNLAGRSGPAAPSGGNCPDGDLPARGLLLDSAGNLYGTTQGGGTSDNGVIFELSKNGKTWSETVLYNICANGGSCPDGTYASSPLMMDGSGNLYGSMVNGAISGSGVLFKLVPNGTSSTYTVLYDFCSQSGCTDGQEPFGPLSMDTGGNIFGTAEIGGAYGLGTVYKFSGGAVSVLHSFCKESGCTDGAIPTGGLIVDGIGNLYGTTSDLCEACTAFGSVFRLTP